MEEREKLYRYKIKIHHLFSRTTEIQHYLTASSIIDHTSIKTTAFSTTFCKTIKCTQSELKVLLAGITKIGYTTAIIKIKRLWF